MINPQWLELPKFRTNFHGPKDVRAIEARLYLHIYPKYWDKQAWANSVDPDQTPQNAEAVLTSTHNLCFEQKFEKKKKKNRIFIWKLSVFGGEIFSIFE